MSAADKSAKSTGRKSGGLAKRIGVTIGAALFIAGCIPLPYHYLDGGTVSYKAVLWSVTRKHSIAYDEDLGRGYNVGTKVRVLFFDVYDDVRFEPCG